MNDHSIKEYHGCFHLHEEAKDAWATLSEKHSKEGRFLPDWRIIAIEDRRGKAGDPVRLSDPDKPNTAVIDAKEWSESVEEIIQKRDRCMETKAALRRAWDALSHEDKQTVGPRPE